LRPARRWAVPRIHAAAPRAGRGGPLARHDGAPSPRGQFGRVVPGEIGSNWHGRVRTGAVRTFPWPVAGPPFSAEPELRMHDGNAHLPRPLLAALALVMAATPLAGQEAARHAGS